MSVKEVLLSRVSRLADQGEAARHDIYLAAIKAAAALPEDSQQAVLDRIEDAIREIEADFAARDALVAVPAQAELEAGTANDDGVADRRRARVRFASRIENASAGWITRRRLVLVLAGMIILVALVPAAIRLADMALHRVGNGDEASTQPQGEATNTDPELRTVLDADFSSGSVAFDIRDIEKKQRVPSLPLIDGRPVLAGRLHVFLKDTLPVEAGKTYLGKFVVRLPPDWDRSAPQPRLQAGVWNLQERNKPVSERGLSVFVVNEKLRGTLEPNGNGEVSFVGVITTEQGDGGSAFHEDAKYFRPFIGFHASGSEVTVEPVSYSILVLE